MRIVHTADWHLGHKLGPWDRGGEHDAFLSWLLALLEEEKAHALLVAGDVFDRGNPPPEALSRFYGFVAEARRRLPALQVVVIGGNHDAPQRLDAPAPVLLQLGVHVLGALDLQRCVVPLVGDSGEVEAHACLLPFVRAVDMQGLSSVDEVCARVLDAGRAVARGALVAVAHGEMAGAVLSPDSERRLVSGALSPALFADVAYTALGHLHLAQRVGDSDAVRYSGSPLPLSMTERDYAHAVTVVDLDGARLGAARQRQVPRQVELLRVGSDDAPLDEVLDGLAALALPARPEALQPYLDVRVKLSAPAPDLRGQVERALEGKPVRLVRVQAARPAGEAAPWVEDALVDATPQQVLGRLYQSSYGAELPQRLQDALAELMAELSRDGENEGEAP